MRRTLLILILVFVPLQKAIGEEPEVAAHVVNINEEIQKQEALNESLRERLLSQGKARGDKKFKIRMIAKRKLQQAVK